MMPTAKPVNSKVLICGDSFAADWTVKYSGQGWPNLLCTDYTVTNVAQAGCSEYRIYQQIRQQSLDNYDTVIVWHTSPYRIPVERHPVHAGDALHGHSDLLYTDIKSHAATQPELQCIAEFYERYFDAEYAIFVYRLILEQIVIATHRHPNVIHAMAQDWQQIQYRIPGLLDFYRTWRKHPGSINHFDNQGNQLVYKKIKEHINEQATI